MAAAAPPAAAPAAPVTASPARAAPPRPPVPDTTSALAVPGMAPSRCPGGSPPACPASARPEPASARARASSSGETDSLRISSPRIGRQRASRRGFSSAPPDWGTGDATGGTPAAEGESTGAGGTTAGSTAGAAPGVAAAGGLTPEPAACPFCAAAPAVPPAGAPAAPTEAPTPAAAAPDTAAAPLCPEAFASALATARGAQAVFCQLPLPQRYWMPICTSWKRPSAPRLKASRRRHSIGASAPLLAATAVCRKMPTPESNRNCSSAKR